jgi:hypothetical protein
MGDFAYTDIDIYDIPTNEIAALQLVLDNEFGTGAMVAEVGESFVEEHSLGLERLADRITRAAPGATWIMRQALTFLWMGEKWIYTPTLGLFYADVDADNNIRLHPKLVTQIVSEPNPAHTLDRKLGGPWMREINGDPQPAEATPTVAPVAELQAAIKLARQNADRDSNDAELESLWAVIDLTEQLIPSLTAEGKA